jgi:predicted transcriptional regulator
MKQKVSNSNESESFGKIELSSTNWSIQPSDIVMTSPYCARFPALSENSRKELFEDIRANGVLTPITVMRGTNGSYIVLDGHHRLDICRELREPCPSVIYEELSDEEQARIAFSSNLKRRGVPNRGWRMSQVFWLHDKLGWGYQKLANAVGAKKTTVRYWLKQKEREVQICTPSDYEKIREEISRLNKTLKSPMYKNFEKVEESINKIKNIMEEGNHATLLNESKMQWEEIHSIFGEYQKLLSGWSDFFASLSYGKSNDTEDCLADKDDDILEESPSNVTETNDVLIAC